MKKIIEKLLELERRDNFLAKLEKPVPFAMKVQTL